MKNLLVGNGVTIQFGGQDYTNAKIIKRAQNNVNTKNFPKDIYPHETLQYLIIISERIPAILRGDYDEFAILPSIKRPLDYFKKKYSNLKSNFRIHDIGFEDYFTVHMMFCYKERIQNPERYNFKECLRMLFLDSIYNFSKIQYLYKKYPSTFVGFLNGFDNIFTTNYDWNLEKATEKEIGYLHGAFHHLSDIYNENSFRNQLDDKPIQTQGLITPEEYRYLHSTALTDSTGEDKEFVLNMHRQANEAISKLATGYINKADLRSQIDEWQSSDNQLVKNMYNAMKLKIRNPSLCFQEYDAYKMFREIKGSLTIIGLSPCNDNHIFNNIESNDAITRVIYYYWDIKEATQVKGLLNSKIMECRSVIDFWNSYGV